MKNLSVVLFLAVAVIVVEAQEGSSVSQVLTVEVKPITKISVTGNPEALIVRDATPGSDLSSVSDENTKYSVTTNLDNMKIVASINDRMPEGTRLMIRLNSSKSTSSGPVDISNALTPVNVVTGINKGSEQDQTIRYIFAADASVGELQTKYRTITLTLTN
ncbi:MAG: hypothetical protein HY562_12430 [Ignavibacteriales bacterium]|nr:hypothetical protein [Ignavibacteriales bacterium]